MGQLALPNSARIYIATVSPLAKLSNFINTKSRQYYGKLK
jgi:hypothetical protein